ncbi:TetR/AcrR family transcriptional regulator [Methanobacterium congolense]|uniref:TetR/AcrR family transcriptional regulator n=1 Tax=Methanobacterium congolense TaxID=118062 RepID=UPI0009042136|nr:TetR/AcrR family transcriptional regulator [Methanobacterium congolense]
MSIKELKIKEKEDRRKYILDIAQKLFIYKDYDNVSMNDIAQEVGVNKATLYNYFKNKEALYFAVVLRGVQILDEMIKKEVKKGDTGFEKFRLFGNANNEFYNKYPDCMGLLYSPQSNKFDVSNINASEEYKEVMKILKELIFIMSDSIQFGVDDGTIRDDVNPVEAAILISLISQSMSNMSCLHRDILESRGSDEKQFSTYVKGIIHQMLMKKED